MRSLLSVVCSLAVLGSAAAAPEHETCCTRAKAAGVDCTHKCCIKARKEGKRCEKCNGKKNPKEDAPPVPRPG
jgi:hypothetical protein